MEQRVVVAVEFEWQQAESVAQRAVERGGDPQPAAIEMKLGEAVADEQVVVHRRLQFVAGEMIQDIGEAQTGGDADGTGTGRQQHGLGYAPVGAGFEHGRCPIVVGVGRQPVGVVSEPVAHIRVELHRPIIGSLGSVCDLGSPLPDGWVVGVDEPGRLEVFVHWFRLASWCFRVDGHAIAATGRWREFDAVDPSVPLRLPQLHRVVKVYWSSTEREEARSFSMHIKRIPARRSLGILIATVSLIAASCGDSGSTTAAGGATTAPPTTAASTTAAPATTAAPTTTAAATTTKAAPEVTNPPKSPLPEGSSTGQWNNTTFGSTGKAISDVGVTGDTLSVLLDLTDGFVLGQGISDVFSIDLPISELAAGYTIDNPFLGTLKITIKDGKVDVVGTGTPVAGISGFTATGIITDTSLSGTYEVQFDTGDPAVGTFDFPIG